MKKRFFDFLKSNSYCIELGIGEVKLKGLLGLGGNGVVYQGDVLGNTFAFKFLLSDIGGKSYKSKLERFLAEYINIKTLPDNKGIVKYIDYDVYNFHDNQGETSIPVIIMKRYEGALKSITGDNYVNEFENVFNFLIDTVEKLHNEGIIHRDIKPQNILLNDREYVLADFGIASFNPEIFSIRAKTENSERLGNRLFSAPEQENGGMEANPTMDIYAIGQVLHWLVYGEIHRGTNRTNVAEKYPELSRYDIIIDKCLCNNPKDRYQSIEEIRGHLLSMKEEKKDHWDYLGEFNEILVRSFPKNEDGIIYSNNPNKIDRLFTHLKENDLHPKNGSGLK